MSDLAAAVEKRIIAEVDDISPSALASLLRELRELRPAMHEVSIADQLRAAAVLLESGGADARTAAEAVLWDVIGGRP